ncbi:MAG: hypothetical protein BroJett011_46010 [Chloroflexota bacterium]|nr:MAG: hypothetical protein BroJett011_46010 [Chloroflexota bacterium]
MTVDSLNHSRISTPVAAPSTSQPATLNLHPVTDIAISVRNVSKIYPLYAQPSGRLKQSLWYSLPSPADFGPRRPGDPATLIASSEAIRRDLGWQPRYSDLEQIVGDAWEWFRRHPEGYGSS